MDMGFYAGMGFDGYRLALETPRIVELDTKRIRFDGRYVLEPSPELVDELAACEHSRRISKETYYGAYGSALKALFTCMKRGSSADEALLERMAASALILLCGGHKGCKQHITPEEEFSAQMESLIIFSHARNMLAGEKSLETAPLVRAVS